MSAATRVTLGDRFLLPIRMREALAGGAPAGDAMPDDTPRWRSLWVYILDQADTGLRRPGMLLTVPFEPLAPGPTGSRFAVDPSVPARMFDLLDWSPQRRAGLPANGVDLDAAALAANGGLAPTSGDPRFAAQMAYAVCHHVFGTFTHALGREQTFGPWLARSLARGGRHQLLIQPYAFDKDNAYYEPQAGLLQFGFFENTGTESALTAKGNVQQYVLSHDIICHELSHAILDGMRARFMDDTGPDVAGFHEGFADLIALLHHFTCGELVKQAIEETGGIGVQALLSLGRQLGETDSTKGGNPMRTAMASLIAEARIDGTLQEAWSGPDSFDLVDQPPRHRFSGPRPAEPHDRGLVLVDAVMEAFLVTFRRRARPYRRLAQFARPSDMRGLPAELVELLCKEVNDLAAQFLRMVIRAIDYCPPVDIRFGEFLRAMITVDRELVPDDQYDSRGALIRAFRRRNIPIDHVRDLSEESLCWSGPPEALPPVTALAFSQLRLDDAGAAAIDEAEMRRWASAIGAFMGADPGRLPMFGLHAVGDGFGPVVLESANVFGRLDGERRLKRGLVLEITQTRRDERGDFVGGATVILGLDGAVRYIVSKRVDSPKRRKLQAKYLGARSSARVDLASVHATRGSAVRAAQRSDPSER